MMRFRSGGRDLCRVFARALPFHVLPAAAQQPDDILELSKRMVELQRSGQHAGALPLAQRAVELSEEALGPEDPAVAIYLDH
jgi:hypothetical protein